MKLISSALIVAICSLNLLAAEHQTKSYVTVYKAGRQKISVSVIVDLDSETVFSRPVSESRAVLETLHDFKQKFAAYRSADDDSCYLEKLELASLNEEIELLEKFKGVLIRDPPKTLFVSNLTLAVDDVISVGGSNLQKFCKGRSVHWLHVPDSEKHSSEPGRTKRSADHFSSRPVKRRFHGQVHAQASPSSDGANGPDAFAIASQDAAIAKVGGGSGFAQANSHVSTETEYENGMAFRQMSASSSMNSKGAVRGNLAGSLTANQGSFEKGEQFAALPPITGNLKGFSSHQFFSSPLQTSFSGGSRGTSQVSGSSSFSSFSSGSLHGQSGLGFGNTGFPSSSFLTSGTKGFQVPLPSGPIPQDAVVTQEPGSPYKTYTWKIKHPNGYQSTHWYTGPVGPDNKPATIEGPIETSPLELKVPSLSGNRRTIAGGFSAGSSELRTIGLGVGQNELSAERAHEEAQSLFSSFFGGHAKLFGEKSGEQLAPGHRRVAPAETSEPAHIPEPVPQRQPGSLDRIQPDQQVHHSSSASLYSSQTSNQHQVPTTTHETIARPVQVQAEQEQQLAQKRRFDIQQYQQQNFQQQHFQQQEGSKNHLKVQHDSRHPVPSYPNGQRQEPAHQVLPAITNSGGIIRGTVEQSFIQQTSSVSRPDDQRRYPVRQHPQKPVQSATSLLSQEQRAVYQAQNIQNHGTDHVATQTGRQYQTVDDVRNPQNIQHTGAQGASRTQVQREQAVIQTTAVRQEEGSTHTMDLHDKMLNGQTEESLNTMLHIMEPHVPENVGQLPTESRPYPQRNEPTTSNPYRGSHRSVSEQRETHSQQQVYLQGSTEPRHDFDGTNHGHTLSQAAFEVRGAQESSLPVSHQGHFPQDQEETIDSYPEHPRGQVRVTQINVSRGSSVQQVDDAHDYEGQQRLQREQEDLREREVRAEQIRQRDEQLRQRAQQEEMLRQQRWEHEQEMLRRQELEREHKEKLRQQELEQQRQEMLRQQEIERKQQEEIRRQEEERRRQEQETLRQQEAERQQQELLRKQELQRRNDLERQRQEALRRQEAERQRQEMLRQQQLEKEKRELLRRQEAEKEQELLRHRQAEEEHRRQQHLELERYEKLRRQEQEQRRQQALEQERQQVLGKQKLEQEHEEGRLRLEQGYLQEQRQFEQTQTGYISNGHIIPSGRADIPPEHDQDGQSVILPDEGYEITTTARPVRPVYTSPTRPAVKPVPVTPTTTPAPKLDESYTLEDYDTSDEEKQTDGDVDYSKPCSGRDNGEDGGCGFVLSGSSSIVSQVQNPSHGMVGSGQQAMSSGHRRIVQYYRSSQTQSSSGVSPGFTHMSSPVTSSSSQCSSFGYTCKTVYGPYERKKICTPTPPMPCCSTCS